MGSFLVAGAGTHGRQRGLTLATSPESSFSGRGGWAARTVECRTETTSARLPTFCGFPVKSLVRVPTGRCIVEFGQQCTAQWMIT